MSLQANPININPIKMTFYVCTEIVTNDKSSNEEDF